MPSSPDHWSGRGECRTRLRGRCRAASPFGCSRSGTWSLRHLTTRAGARGGSDPRSRPANCRLRVARHGVRPGSALDQRPPRAEPQQMVRQLTRPSSVRPARRYLRPRRQAGRGRPRRHHRAAMGGQHQEARHLPRSGALLPRPLRQGERPALAGADGGAAGATRWVLARDPSGQREPQAFLSTNLHDMPVAILAVSVRVGAPGRIFKKSATIPASRPSGNGRNRPSCIPRRRCSGCSRW